MGGGGSTCERGEACFLTGYHGVSSFKFSELVLLSSVYFFAPLSVFAGHSQVPLPFLPKSGFLNPW